MAASERLHEEEAGTALRRKLAAVLPKGHKFGILHLSTPPFRTDALCSAPPGARPDRTYCENHFLALSIEAKQHTKQPGSRHEAAVSDAAEQILVLALEIFVFTTAYSTIFFVSKADSTGYLHLLNLPQGTPSPIREVSAAFISFLIECRRRNDVQTVVSLFARAQAQYLFPGSIENKGKHVLDDRGLVKWWCKVLNPLLEPRDTLRDKTPASGNVAGYLVIPGLDAYESRAFLPRTPTPTGNWILGHPLEKISHFSSEYDWVPPRCLIPRYPDDPKSRFRDELDGEASHWAEYQEKGTWKSVKTLEQFWDMMAFRQECSGGHMTGFIWVVFDPPGANPPLSPKVPMLTSSTSFTESQQALVPSTPPRRRTVPGSITPRSSPLKPGTPSSSQQRTPVTQSPAKTVAPRKTRKRALKGQIEVRQPRIKTHAKNYSPDIPTSTAYYNWPSEGRGVRILTESDYKQSVELLLRLDFANLDIAIGSTKRWISEVGGGMRWELDIVGQKSKPVGMTSTTVNSSEVNNMTNLVRKKRPAEFRPEPVLSDTPPTDPTGTSTSSSQNGALKASKTTQPAAIEAKSGRATADGGVNVLDVSLMRKKRKAPEQEEPRISTGVNGREVASIEASAGGRQVTVLGPGPVRKKPKAS